MIRTTQKELRNMVSSNQAIDVTMANAYTDIPEPYTAIAYSQGTYGCNGRLFKGDKTGTLYAVTTRSTALWIF